MENILAVSPQRWTTSDVRLWLSWCSVEYSLNLDETHLEKFSMNGKAFLMLTRDDFCHRLPDNHGDVIYNVLRHFTNGVYATQFPGCYCLHGAYNSGNDWTKYSPPTHETVIKPHSPVSPSALCSPMRPWSPLHEHVTNTIDTKPPPSAPMETKPSCDTIATESNSFSSVYIKSEACHSPRPSFDKSACLPPKKRQIREPICEPTESDVVTSSNMAMEAEDEHEILINESTLDTTMADSGEDDPEDICKTSDQIESGNNKLLWEFIVELLNTPGRQHPVSWHDESTLTFRITDKNHFADLWGQQKHKGNMNYEKLSRALRYYYKMKIISKVPGKKLIYRFATPPSNIKKGIRGAKPGVPHKRRRKLEDSSMNGGKKAKVKNQKNVKSTGQDVTVLDLSSKPKVRRRRKPEVAASPCLPSSTASDSGVETDIRSRDASYSDNLSPREIITPQTFRYPEVDNNDTGLDLRFGGDRTGSASSTSLLRLDNAGFHQKALTSVTDDLGSFPVSLANQLCRRSSPTTYQARETNFEHSERSPFSVVTRSTMNNTIHDLTNYRNQRFMTSKIDPLFGGPISHGPVATDQTDRLLRTDKQLYQSGQ